MKLSFAGHEAPSGTDRTAEKVDRSPDQTGGSEQLSVRLRVSAAEAVGGAAEDVMTKHRYRNLEQWQTVKLRF